MSDKYKQTYYLGQLQLCPLLPLKVSGWPGTMLTDLDVPMLAQLRVPLVEGFHEMEARVAAGPLPLTHVTEGSPEGPGPVPTWCQSPWYSEFQIGIHLHCRLGHWPGSRTWTRIRANTHHHHKRLLYGSHTGYGHGCRHSYCRQHLRHRHCWSWTGPPSAGTIPVGSFTMMEKQSNKLRGYGLRQTNYRSVSQHNLLPASHCHY